MWAYSSTAMSLWDASRAIDRALLPSFNQREKQNLLLFHYYLLFQHYILLIYKISKFINIKWTQFSVNKLKTCVTVWLGSLGAYVVDNGNVTARLLQQERDDLSTPVLAGTHEGCGAFIILYVYTGTALKQRSHHLLPSVAHGQHECSLTSLDRTKPQRCSTNLYTLIMTLWRSYCNNRLQATVTERSVSSRILPGLPWHWRCPDWTASWLPTSLLPPSLLITLPASQRYILPCSAYPRCTHLHNTHIR